MPIKSIRITNYRAFLNTSDKERNRYFIELSKGNNLLIYGENGSGKSSLFNALQDFFQSAGNRFLPFAVNTFYDPDRLSELPSIHIRFQDEPTDHGGHYFSQDITLTNTPECNQIANGNVISGFLSYRNLLKFHFFDPEDKIDYFTILFGEKGLFAKDFLLAPLKIQNKIPFAELWQRITANPDTQDIADYNVNAADLLTRLQVVVNHLLSFFDKELELVILYENVTSDASPAKISFAVRLFKRAIPAHHGVLNEARLTSIAISIYLGHLLSQPDTPFKFLFLDDIFIGLDTSNRIPLLDILTARNLDTPFTFRNFQVFITTYDREWFELAGSRLDKDWKKIELYADTALDSIERPLIKRWGTYRQKAEGYIAGKDYPAAANYLRKAFENELRRILPANILYPGLPDSSEKPVMIGIPKSHFEMGENEDEWLFNMREGMISVPAANQHINLHSLISKFGAFVKKYKIPYADLEDLQLIRSRILNPLSHDNIHAPVFKRELIHGLELLDNLISFRSDIVINVENNLPVFFTATDTNFEGIVWSYRFEILENVRLIKYQHFIGLINGKCRYISKKGQDETAHIEPKEYHSLSELCKGIRYNSVPKAERKTLAYDSNFEFTIFNDEGKTLTNLIDEQNL